MAHAGRHDILFEPLLGGDDQGRAAYIEMR
jgi:hypothetical protein